MRLPVPFEVAGTIYTDCEIKPYTAGVLSDTQKAADAGDIFKILHIFVSGCIEKIGEVVDRQAIKVIVQSMPYKSAEYLAAKIALLKADDDGMESVESCPRCRHSMVFELKDDTDTRIHFSELAIKCADEIPAYVMEFASPVVIEVLDGEDGIIHSLQFVFPTLGHGMKASAATGEHDKSRLHLAVYRECLVGVNGNAVDAKWKNRYALQVLEKMEREQIIDIRDSLNAYGIKQSVSKTCPKCGKVFEVTANTTDFFVSALR